MRRHHAHDRDDSLRRLSRVNRWLLAGSLALTGVLTDVVANAFPGSAHASSSTGAGSKHHRRHAKHSPTSTGALKPPAHAPEAIQQPASEAATEPSPEATHEPPPAPSSSQGAPSEESAPTREAQPTPEPEPSREPEASAPAEASAPVVSGGS
jgi:type IV secretory pathway VirB10-like protein